MKTLKVTDLNEFSCETVEIEKVFKCWDCHDTGVLEGYSHDAYGYRDGVDERVCPCRL